MDGSQDDKKIGGVTMSHTVQIDLIADQEIEVGGKVVNIHDIQTIELLGDFRNMTIYLKCEHCGYKRVVAVSPEIPKR